MAEVDRMKDALQAYGIDTWIDRYNISPGSRWQDEIRHAIAGGAFFLACFSKEYLEKETSYMNEELTLAIEELRKRPTSRAWFIPICLSQCNIPDRSIGGGETLRDIQAVSLYRDFDDGIFKILTAIKPNSAPVYKLITQLRDRSARVRIRAADNLGKIGKFAEPAIPSLLVALKDDHVTVRGVAADSLGKIGVSNEEVIVALLRIDDDGSHYGTQHAIEAIRKFGRSAVPTLIKYIDSDRFQTTLALREIGKEAKEAVPELIRVLEEDQISFADQALGAIGDHRAIPALIRVYKKVINSTNDADKIFPVIALATIGEPTTSTYSYAQAAEVAKRVIEKWEREN
jgi:HEAT repeat protein